ncbi:DUF4271 domain-containing protein [Polaribacter pacificus]|uniref:DUF4271 domain-containing protein n=1 Tax=Polaribacter pacificus TaxID=1775173 RepID=UPI0016695203
MQIANRVVESNNWVLLTLLFGLFLLFLLKKINAELLLNYSKAFFIKGFVEKKAQEKVSFFSLTSLLLFLFSGVVLALFSCLIAENFIRDQQVDFQFFIYILIGILLYILASYFIEYLVIRIFSLKNTLGYFMISKRIYLFTFSIWLFPFLILSFYSFSSGYVALAVAVFMFLLSLILIFSNNKNLIVSELFYFILYLCILKIAPLLFIYKIVF